MDAQIDATKSNPKDCEVSGAVSSPRHLDQVRDAIRLKHYSIRTEHTYIDWIKRYILFHKKTAPERFGRTSYQLLSHTLSG